MIDYGVYFHEILKVILTETSVYVSVVIHNGALKEALTNKKDNHAI